MDTPEILPKTKNDSEKQDQPVKKSKEVFFGKLLFAGIVVAVVAFVASVVWGGYHGYRISQQQSALLSIGSLAKEEKKAESEEKMIEPAEGKEKDLSADNQKNEIQVKAKNTEIKALNGGAAKGSAGKVSEILKKDGFSKVLPGNTLNDYTGSAVYFSPGLEQEANFVKETLLKEYPKVEVKAAIKTNAETTQAPIVIIVGR